MSLDVRTTKEPEGTLRYECAPQDVVVRVFVQRRNGTKKCPVEILHQGGVILATDCNLRELRDLENLQKHAGTLRNGPAWHEILTAVAAELPDADPTPWDPVSAPLSSFTIRPKAYLWYPLIPKAEPTSLEGDPNVGKSATLIKVFCHLTSGKRFPTLFSERPEQDFTPRRVLLFTYEDDPESTILPRVVLNGGNPALVEIIQGKRDPETKAVLPMTLQDLHELEVLLTRLQPALMAFDPIQSFFGPEVDMNRAGDTRPVLDRVAALGKAHGCTPLYIRHNGKSQRSKAIHASLGSIDITAHMRSVLTLYQDPEEKARRTLAHTKKHGREAPSINLKLIGATLDVPTDDGIETIEEVRIEWDGMNALSSEDLNARESLHGNDTEEEQSALDQAREFLHEVLKDGPVLADEIYAHAKKAGVSAATLRRAKDKDHYKARRQPQEGVPGNKWPWEWYNPTQTTARS
jgi:RecA-family ATPase